MDGEVDTRALDDFNDLLSDYPDIDRIEMTEVPGSLDDEINLLISRQVHERGIATHLLDGGLVASGGTDFFVAGATRTRGANTMIGVHSWSDEASVATDYPRGDPNHQPYIDFYRAVGFTLAGAEDFYYFTIEAAPADSMYYLTDADLARFNILTR